MLEVTVRVLDPDNGELRFPQFITFVSDTEPPAVEEVSVTDEGNLVVVASDRTTSALNATLWVSADGGATWEQREMSPDPDLDAELHEDAFVPTRRFTAALPGGAVQYLVSIQDSVFNAVFYGPSEVQR